MNGLMWILFIVMIALLILSLLWLIWKLRYFSQSQNQTYLDDRLMQAMLKDQDVSKKIKKALVKKSSGLDATDEEDETSEQPEEKAS